MKFYDKDGNGIDTPLSDMVDEAWMRRVLIPIIDKTSCISIRLLDWLMTNYSKEKSIDYQWVDQNGHPRRFMIHEEYKQTLKTKQRKLFDPFRRGKRMYFDVDGRHETTMGQVIFFLWCDKYKVLDYLYKHVSLVEQHMAERQEAGKKRRRITKTRGSLSSEPSMGHVFFSSKCTFSFDDD